MEMVRFAALRDLEGRITKVNGLVLHCAAFKAAKYQGAVPKVLIDYMQADPSFALKFVEEVERRVKEKHNELITQFNNL